jgi:serine O-acetyltransferase
MVMEKDKNYTTHDLIKADMWRYHGRYSMTLLLKTFITSRTFRPVLTLRLCQAANTLSPFLKIITLPPLVILHRWFQNGGGMDIPWKCNIGPGFRITHGWGLVVHDDVVIGSNVTVFHGVTIGSKRKGDLLVAPIIGNDVVLSAGSIIIGEVNVGNGAIVGAGAIVVKDVAASSVVVSDSSKEILTGIEPRVSYPFPIN